MLAYLSRHPSSIDVVDLNPHHIALNRLKLAAFRSLPGHSDVVRFLAMENVSGNVEAFDRVIAQNLDATSRTYWQKRRWNGQRRIEVFERNIYRTGLLGRFIAVGHLLARLHGVQLTELANAKSLREQRHVFDTRIAPLFDKVAHQPQEFTLRPWHSAAAI
jgi:S-adenosylmethionine-diacylglycerol 3-amino-3-carboxypropyl transferase